MASINTSTRYENNSRAFKILIVDDEEDICYFLSRNLNKRSFITSITHTLADAEKKIFEEQPAIVLLDNYLPDGLGIDHIHKLKNKCPNTKVVVLTAHDSADDRAKAYRNGASYFLAKPFTINEINNIVDLITEKPD